MRLALLGILATLAAPAAAAELRLDIDGFDAAEGFAMVSLYESPQAMEEGVATAALKLPVLPPGVAAVGVALPPGRYAISVFHDRNGNGKLDRNLVGGLTEAYGFGNDARGSYGRPSFEAAAIVLPADGGHARITVR